MSFAKSTERVLPASESEYDLVRPSSPTRAACRQVAANFASGLACLVVGSCMGWPSPMLERMSSAAWVWPGVTGDGREGAPLTGDQSSWVVSLLDLGVVIGSLPAGWAADRWGRRPVLLGSSLFFVASWLLILLAQGPVYLYAGRLLQGLGSAVAMVVTAMYAAEVSEDRLRGANCTLIATLMNLGTVVAYSVGPYVSYRTLACCLLALPALFVLCFAWAPESPYWLIMQGHRTRAEAVLQYLRHADGLTVSEEADEMEKSIMEQSSSPGLLSSARELLLVRGADRTAFGVVLALTSLQSLSGFNAMLAYSAVTLPGGLVLDQDQFVIFFGVVSTLSVLVGMVVIDRVGRRPLLLVFSALQALSLAGSSLYYSLSARTALDLSGLAWLPPAALLLYGVAYPIGLGSVPNALQMEMFSTRVKAFALPAVLVSFNTLTFVVSKTYEVVWHNLGKDVAFWFFTFDCLVACLVTAFILKETKGKSFQEIQEQLDPRRKIPPPTWPV